MVPVYLPGLHAVSATRPVKGGEAVVGLQDPQSVGLGANHEELLPASQAHCEVEEWEGELRGSPWLCQAEELPRGSPGLRHPSHQPPWRGLLLHPVPQAWKFAWPKQESETESGVAAAAATAAAANPRRRAPRPNPRARPRRD